MITAGSATPVRQPGRSLTDLIERESKRRHRRRALWWMLPPTIALIIAIAWIALRPKPVPFAARFRMQAVSQGDLVREVRATGHVDAVTTVQVGAEISGRIATVEVDYNARVKAGQVLARFDRTALAAQLAQTKATLAASRAAVEQARTDRDRTHSDLARAEQLHAALAHLDRDRLDALSLERLTMLELGAEQPRVGVECLLEVADGDAEVMDPPGLHDPMLTARLDREATAAEPERPRLHRLNGPHRADGLGCARLGLDVGEERP